MRYDITIFGIHLRLNPIAFSIPIGSGWDVYWYGIIIAVGFVLALLYGFKNAKRFDINSDKMLDAILVTTPVAILCARTYYIIFDGEKLQSIGEFFGFGSSGFSGLAIYGAVIGALVCGAVMCYIKKIKILDMFDLAVLGFLIGQGVGRWGNFFNQEAYGDFTGSTWWGMTSNRTAYEMGSDALVHPCFLYESIWCIAGFFLLNYLSKKRVFSGQVTLMYCVWYGFGRAIIELLRTDSLMIGNIRVSFLLSLIICVASAIVLAVMFRVRKRAANDVQYSEMFALQMEEETQEVENDE